MTLWRCWQTRQSKTPTNIGTLHGLLNAGSNTGFNRGPKGRYLGCRARKTQRAQRNYIEYSRMQGFYVKEW